jgi:hypothetical protein
MAIANITNNILTDSGVATSSLLTTSAAASTYLALAGGTLTGALGGTSASFSGTLSTSAGFGILSGGGGYAVGPSATRGIIAVNGSGDQLLTFSTQSYIYNSSSLFRMLSSSDIDFVAGGTQRLLISASTGAATFSSSVSVNTTNAVSTFEIGAAESDGTGSTNAVRIQSKTGASNQQLLIGINQTGLYSFLQSSQASVGYKSLALNPNGGNVGIGTSSPAYKFETLGTSVITAAFGRSDYGASNVMLIAMNGYRDVYKTAIGVVRTGDYDVADMIFCLNGSANGTVVSASDEKMRIKSGGALCLGVTSAYGTNLLNVNGGIYATSSVAAVVAADLDMMVFQNTGATYSKACLVASMTATGGTGSYFFYGQQSTSTAAIKIFSNGNIQNTNNSYGAISDARLKENIKDATPKLDDLMKVKVRNYNLKGESNKQLGVISQELEAIFPNMIEESTNMGENMKIKGVKYSVFVPMLIKAVQELKAEIEILKNK